MKNLLTGLVLIVSLLMACASGKNKAAKKSSGKSYSNLFVFANTLDIELRVLFENDLDASVKASGYQGIRSLQVMPQSLDDTVAPTKQQLMEKLKASGCDALLIVHLVNKQGVNYVPGTKFNGTTPFITGLVTGILGYTSSGNSNYDKSISKPGSFKQENGDYIAVDMLDAATENLVYSENSDMFDEAKLHTFSKAYMTALVLRLKEKKLLAK